MLESVYDELDDTDEFNDDHEYTPFAVWLGNDLYNDYSSSQSAIQIAKILKRQDPNQIVEVIIGDVIIWPEAPPIHIPESVYDKLDDTDEFEENQNQNQNQNPYPYELNYGGGAKPYVRHGAYSNYDVAVERAHELAQFINDQVEVTKDTGDDYETVYVATPSFNESIYDKLDDTDEFENKEENEDEWQLAYEIQVDGYLSDILLYQNIERPEFYDINIDLNQTTFVDWGSVSDHMVKDYAVLFGIKNLNETGLREKTLKTIWDHMLKRKNDWITPMPTNPGFIPYLIGSNQWGMQPRYL